jgi:hypothetical protein
VSLGQYEELNQLASTLTLKFRLQFIGKPNGLLCQMDVDLNRFS